ncbi:MAG: DUF885 family protein, partial [Pirellulales bacterium]
NNDIFGRRARDAVAEGELETYLMPITNRDGFHVEFAELGQRVPLATVKDYENYIARLAAFRKYAQQHAELMTEGIKKKMVLPAIVLEGFKEPITAHIVDDPTKSLLYKPFTKFPAGFSAADRDRLAAEGRRAIAESVVPGYREFLAFMEKQYVPAAPGTIGASSLPQGRELYRHRVRHFTTLDRTPEEVHQIGLSEVKRIRAEMEQAIHRTGFRGDFAAFLAHLRSDSRFYADSPAKLMKEVALVLKRMDGELPKLFRTLPRMPYGIREVPAYIAPRTTTAYYSLPAGDGRDAGYYYVNTHNLKSRPLYEVEALSLHEAVPGHHLQLALQQELTKLPKFRRFAGFTVFVEGWALYAERLGLEVGFYQDPYSDFGRLTYEMWRACRLVVDTGIHYLGWTREQAIDFMSQNTGLSIHNITAEVDRYIAWPGQALAYKTGEMAIRSLREEAQRRLGARFDVRAFHEVVLGSGAVPLSVLEENVRNYIEENLRAMARTEPKQEITKASTGPLAGGTRAAAKLAYPPTRKIEQVDEYHGQKIADPYRWLEDDNASDTRAWVEAQNKITFAHLESIPERAKLRERLTKLWNYEKFGTPTSRGGRYFYERNTGLQNQNVLYVADSLEAEPRVLLDPNTLSKDGTVALSGTELSDDGKLLAYGISTAGSDWKEWKVRDTGSGDTGMGQDLPDHIKWAKFSDASWTKDGKGFYYSRYDEPTEATKLTGTNYFQKLYYHRLGTPQSEDKLIHHRPDAKELGFQGRVTDDGKYLLIHVWRGSERKNGISYMELEKPDAKVVDLLTDFEAEYDFVGNEGSVFWFRTDRDAPRARIVAIDFAKPGKSEWKELVPQTADALESAYNVGERLILSYLHDAHSRVREHDLAGKHVRDIELPGIGTAAGFGGKRGDKETFYAFTSYTTPTTIFRYDLASGKSTVFRQPKVDFNPADYETVQVFFASKDGTRVPIFLSYKKGLKRDGSARTILYGYGGFNISLSPSFSVTSLVWMESGGIWAVANLRGGGEYGREWHEAGMRTKKQNVFDDFIAAAEYLIGNGYTSRDRLAIQGGSNGGLLVGACMTQRPDLYAVCIPAVGVMDMLRYHKFTIGWAWAGEYGSSDEPDMAKYLAGYSPLQNLKPGTKYPATLVTTADHDDRVVPAHSFKYAAALQAAQAGEAPTLIRIETRAGHGAGKPTAKRIEEAADVLAFILHHTRDK